MAEWGWNLKKPPIEVKHSELERASDESAYRSICPVCHEGVLLISRPIGVFKLRRDERCTLCGQTFWYTDDTVNGETFVDVPKHLTPEILAAFAQLAESLPERGQPVSAPTIWDRLLDSER